MEGLVNSVFGTLTFQADRDALEARVYDNLASPFRVVSLLETPIAAGESGQPDCAVNPAINKDATGFRYLPLGCDPDADCQSVRVFVLSLTNRSEIPDGAVLYTCRIAIAADAALGSHALLNREVAASAALGEEVPTTGIDGSVDVGTGPVASTKLCRSCDAPWRRERWSRVSATTPR